MKPEFDIETCFVDKDASQIIYREGPRALTSDYFHGAELILGALDTWDDGTIMTADERARVIDRLSRHAFDHGIRRVHGRADAPPLRLPGEFDIELSFWSSRPLATYYEVGRATTIVGRQIGNRATPQARLYPALTSHWSSRAPLNDDERARITARLAKLKGVVIEDARAPTDSWDLAAELSDWRSGLTAVVDQPYAFDDARENRPPTNTLFWRVELDAACKGGNIARSADEATRTLRVGTLAPAAGNRLRDWLFVEDLPITPVDLSLQPSETRLQLWGYRTTPPTPELADRVLGAVLERRDASATAAFALYADGRARYLAPDTIVVWELCEADFARAWLTQLQPFVADAPRGRNRAHLESGQFRLTLLTPSGPRAPATIDRAFIDACSAFIGRMIDVTVPLVPAPFADQQNDAARLLDQKQYLGALAAAENAIAVAPAEARSHWLAGFIRMRNPARTPADIAAAIVAYQQALTLQPRYKTAGWLVDLCGALVEAGRNEEALATMRQHLQSFDYTVSARAHNWLGWYFTYRSPELNLALEHCRKAAEIDPAWGTAWLNLAYAEDRLGLLDDAYVHYRESLRFKPYNAQFAEQRAKELEEKLKVEGKPLPLILHGMHSGRLLGARCYEIDRAAREGRFNDAAELLFQIRPHTEEFLDSEEIATRAWQAAAEKGEYRAAARIVRLIESMYDAWLRSTMKEPEGDEYRAKIVATKELAEKLERKAVGRED